MGLPRRVRVDSVRPVQDSRVVAGWIRRAPSGFRLLNLRRTPLTLPLIHPALVPTRIASRETRMSSDSNRRQFLQAGAVAGVGFFVGGASAQDRGKGRG